MFIMFMRGLGMTLIFLYPMTKFYGLDGIWMTLPIAEATTTLLIIWWMKKKMV